LEDIVVRPERIWLPELTLMNGLVGLASFSVLNIFGGMVWIKAQSLEAMLHNFIFLLSIKFVHQWYTTAILQQKEKAT